MRLQSTPAVGGCAYKARLQLGGALTKHACSWGARLQSTPAVGERAYKAPNQRYECHLGIPRLPSGVRLQSTKSTGRAYKARLQLWGALTKHACSCGARLQSTPAVVGRAYKARLPFGARLQSSAMEKNFTHPYTNSNKI